MSDSNFMAIVWIICRRFHFFIKVLDQQTNVGRFNTRHFEFGIYEQKGKSLLKVDLTRLTEIKGMDYFDLFHLCFKSKSF